VNDGIIVEVPNVPTLLLTVANVNTVEPVTSPVCVALLVNPIYSEFTALSPIFVPIKILPNTVPLARILPVTLSFSVGDVVPIPTFPYVFAK
jgi:hypothetical protein